MNPSASHQATYTYDGLNRLTHAVATGNAIYDMTFSYDQYGNMTWVPGSGTVLTFDASSNHISLIGSLHAGYDSAGNMTSDGTHTYQYDAEGRLTSVDGGSTESQVYNALRQQVQVSTPTYALNALFDTSGQWMARNRAGNWDVGGVFHLDGRQFGIYIDQFNGIHENVLGSSDSTTNAAGSETGQSLFYPWGQTWSLGSAAWNFSAFEYGSPAPILYPTLFRTYDPGVGRWMTPDPMGGDVTNPQSFNRYAYVLNNPTTLTDPMGLHAPYAVYKPPACDTLDCDEYSGAAFGNDVFDALGGSPGAYLTMDAYGNLGVGFSIDKWWQDERAQEVAFENSAAYSNGFQNQLSAATTALKVAGATNDEIAAFVSRNEQDFANGSIDLTGGNFDFSGASIFQFIYQNANLCPHLRCDLGTQGTLDFSHGNGTLHLDTADPFSEFGLGLLVHFGVDVIWGNMGDTILPR